MKPYSYLLCGLPGSGKTTFAQQLRTTHSAEIFSSDEWIIKLFGLNFDSDKFETYQEIAKQKILESAQKYLQQGKNIVLDFGFWKKQDRSKYIEWAVSNESIPIIYYFNISYDSLALRLDERNQKNR